MLGLFVFFVGFLPFVLGLYALRRLGREGGPPSDDPPPPPPCDPEPTAPTRPYRARDRGPIPHTHRTHLHRRVRF